MIWTIWKTRNNLYFQRTCWVNPDKSSSRALDTRKSKFKIFNFSEVERYHNEQSCDEWFKRCIVGFNPCVGVWWGSSTARLHSVPVRPSAVCELQCGKMCDMRETNGRLCRCEVGCASCSSEPLSHAKKTGMQFSMWQCWYSVRTADELNMRSYVIEKMDQWSKTVYKISFTLKITQQKENHCTTWYAFLILPAYSFI
jgi:hypothetical protein